MVVRINHLGDWGTQFGKLIVESQGAQVIDLERYNMPPCLITKSDDGSIYHSRDIAAILYRKEKFQL